ncbi:hypothetical protein ACOMHN_039852 [Nucella lapillus]
MPLYVLLIKRNGTKREVKAFKKTMEWRENRQATLFYNIFSDMGIIQTDTDCISAQRAMARREWTCATRPPSCAGLWWASPCTRDVSPATWTVPSPPSGTAWSSSAAVTQIRTPVSPWDRSLTFAPPCLRSPMSSRTNACQTSSPRKKPFIHIPCLLPATLSDGKMSVGFGTCII